VFCFDTLLPRYQWRHKISEVEGWLRDEGLDPVRNVYSFYTASNLPALPPAASTQGALAGGVTRHLGASELADYASR
jgi:hypothetical protein